MKTKLLILSALALLFHATSWAYDFSATNEGKTIYYNITSEEGADDKTVEVTYESTSYKSYSGTVKIPETVTYDETTYTVTSIGTYAFFNCTSLTSVTIGDNVTSIESMAFNSCTGLTSVNFGNSVQAIYGSAFGYCTSLTEVTLPESLTYIGGTAFGECTSLKTINIPSSVTGIGNSAFTGCSKLTSVEIPDGVTSIQYNTFYNCSKLTSVTIGKGVTSIGDNAFYGCTALTSVTIPDAVTSIGSSAFQGCSGLTSVTSNNTTPPECQSNTFNNVPTTTCPLTVPEGSEDDYASATGWENFRHINDKLYGGEVGDKIEVDGIYYNVTADTEVEVTWGGSSRTAGTSSYTGDIEIPETVEYNKVTYTVTGIGTYAFYGCYFTSVEMPESVTSIGQYAFYNCTSLTSVTIPDAVTIIGNYAFYTCRALTSIDIPNNVKSIGDRAFYGCTDLTTATIGESVTSIGANAFYNCSKLTMLTIGKSMTSIGGYVFANCSKLNSIYSVNPNPPTCQSTTFQYVTTSNVTLYVPVGSTYSSASVWKNFTIVEYYPAVETSDATDVTNSSATLNGSVTAGSGTITEKGFEYWTDESDKKTVKITDNGNEMTTALSKLEEATTYSYYAYATMTDTGISSATTIYGDTKTFTTLNATLLSNLVTAITEVKDSLEEAWTTISTDYSDVSANYEETYKDLAAELDTLLATTNEAYTAGTLNGETEKSVTDSLASITASIADLLADAKTAENAYLYGIISDKIEAVHAELTTVWETIETKCADVAESFNTDYEAIVTDLTTLKQDMESAYEGEELTQETVEEVEAELATISASIAELSANAKTAENAYLYGIISEKISAVETELTTTWSAIETECADVAESFKTDYEAIVTDLTTLKQDTESAYEGEELTQEAVEEVEETLASIEEKIEKLTTDAVAAEENYQLYTATVAKIGAVKTELEEAWETIAEECSDVADTFEETYNDLASQLATLLTSTEATYEAGLLTEEKVEEVEAELATISASIAELLADAKTAENAYLYNTLYEDAVREVEATEESLASAWTTIETKYSDMVEELQKTHDNIAAEIEAVRTELDEAYEAGELTEDAVAEMEEELAAIEKEIADMLSKASIATGIESARSDYGDDVRIYNLAGSRVHNLERGNIYIYRYSDGTVKKVLVK